MQYIDSYENYVFAIEKVFVGQKSRLPATGKIFRGSKKEGEGNETKNHCSDALRSIIKLYGVTRFPSTEKIMKSSSHVSYLWCRL